MKGDLITVDKGEIEVFVKKGSDLVFARSAEENLLKLLSLKDLIDEAIETVKSNIAESATKVFPDFKGVVGDKIKANYRPYGSVYKIDDYHKATEFITERITATPDTAKINDFLEQNGHLPEGIEHNTRELKLSLTRIK